jgi:serine/threonine protein kinase
MQMDFRGQKVGNYTLRDIIGNGGHATVYLGIHDYLPNKKDAIKILKVSDITSQIPESEKNKFLEEGQTIESLTHPNIVRVLDVGFLDKYNGMPCSIPYIVMTWAPQGSLRKAYPEGHRLPIDTIVSYVNQMAKALQYAHDRQPKHIIHCDVKPENMLIMGPGQIVLSDFGIAVANHKTTELPISQGGEQKSVKVFGTVGYMAQERFFGQVSRASDQYSLAIVAYEWLTGHRPFSGNDAEVMMKHLNVDPPSMRTEFPDISEEIEEVVMQALEKDLHERYPTISEFAQAFEQAARSSQRPSQPQVVHQPNPPSPSPQPQAAPPSPPQPVFPSPDPTLPRQQPVNQPNPPSPQPQVQPQPQPVNQPNPPSPRPQPAPRPNVANLPHSQHATTLMPPGPASQGQIHLSGSGQTGPVSSNNTTVNVNSLNARTKKAARAKKQAAGGFQEFKEVFEFVSPNVRNNFKGSRDFLRMPEYFRFRMTNYILIIICAIGLAIDLLQYSIFSVFLIAILPAIMIPIFRWFIQIVKPPMALVIGSIISLYYGFCVWAIIDKLSNIRSLSALTSWLQFVLTVAAIITSFLLNRHYLNRRLK